MYDFVVVGAGFFGAVFAHEVQKAGKRVLVIEKRDHIGGNCYSYDDPETNINIHKYGPHIFHTPDKKIWDYMNSFADFNHYQHRVLTNAGGRIYSMPINLATINQFYNLTLTPGEAGEFLKSKIPAIPTPANLEEKAISLIGPELYETFIKGYTIKQWDCDPGDLPAEVITRLPVRTSYDNIYYNDHYQGMPIGGYMPIFTKLLEGVSLELKTDFFEKRDYWRSLARTIVYTGPIDRYFDYRYGKLRWRSVRFEIEKMSLEDYQGVSIMNYADQQVPYTRILEPKHFYRESINLSRGTVVIREYPCDDPDEPYYPVNLKADQAILSEYQKAQSQEKNVVFGGRLAEYKYYDMYQVISSALKQVEKLREMI
ncbi:MAG: UDP-galactopyranose mutase [Deltaproteobacteria bacterium HGW-Deltaproteobacteria-13]|jgi:UDP-galactopyranose mutase|nr:MAG: UDP-galactopyranose mutase [Deltaproteobacteria bacterium HGW-Deltaproteobacteria-13]